MRALASVARQRSGRCRDRGRRRRRGRGRRGARGVGPAAPGRRRRPAAPARSRHAGAASPPPAGGDRLSRRRRLVGGRGPSRLAWHDAWARGRPCVTPAASSSARPRPMVGLSRPSPSPPASMPPRSAMTTRCSSRPSPSTALAYDAAGGFDEACPIIGTGTSICVSSPTARRSGRSTMTACGSRRATRASRPVATRRRGSADLDRLCAKHGLGPIPLKNHETIALAQQAAPTIP